MKRKMNKTLTLRTKGSLPQQAWTGQRGFR